MKKVLVFLVMALLIIPSIVFATNFETLSPTTSTAIPFTANQITPPGTGMNAQKAFCTVETYAIRYTSDGVTTPTSTVGHLVATGNFFWVSYGDVHNFKMIGISGTAKVSCSYFFELHTAME